MFASSTDSGVPMMGIGNGGFSPVALKQLYGAFDNAWNSIKDATSESDREATREAVGKGIFGLARAGCCNSTHLANYGAYRGRLFIDLRY
jgi:hypothetical protein